MPTPPIPGRTQTQANPGTVRARGITDELDIVFPLLRLSTITNTTPPSAPYSAASGSAVWRWSCPWRELTEHFSGMCKIRLHQRAKLRRDLRTLTEPEFKTAHRLVQQHPDPSAVLNPRPRAIVSSGVSSGTYTKSATTACEGSRPTSISSAGCPCMPSEVVFTSNSASGNRPPMSSHPMGLTCGPNYQPARARVRASGSPDARA